MWLASLKIAVTIPLSNYNSVILSRFQPCSLAESGLFSGHPNASRRAYLLRQAGKLQVSNLMPSYSGGRSRNRPAPRAASPSTYPAQQGQSPAERGPSPKDSFFRHLVSSMRNGVIAIHRDGTIAMMNDEAYRIFSLTRQPNDIGRTFGDLFRDRPDVVRVLSGAFEMTTLPNRAELRLKDINRVIGYTLSQVKDD